MRRFFPFVGGAETHVYLLANEMAKLGHDMFIVSQDSGKPRFSVLDGINIYRVDFQNFQGLTHCLAQLIQRHHIDIVHTHDTLSALATASVRRHLPIPSLWTAHSLPTFRPDDKRMPVADYLLPTISIDAIIAVSKYAATELMRLGFSDEIVRVIYNGVDVERFNPNVSGEAVRQVFRINKDPLIVCAARLHREKGVDILIKAIPEVLNEFPTAKFLITGNGTFSKSVLLLPCPFGSALKESSMPTERGLNRLIHKLGIQSSVIFGKGRFSYLEMPKVYNAADVVVVATRYGETFGMAAAEAMACGRPVIASNVCALPEVIGSKGCGVLFESENPSELASSIRKLLSSPELRDSLGKQARKRVATKFNVRRMTVEMLKLYERVSRSSTN